MPIHRVVIGLALLRIVERNSPIAAKSIFNSRVYVESTTKAIMLNGPFFTSSMLINPARDVTAFRINILSEMTASLLMNTSLLVTGRVRRYSAVLLYSSFRRILEE